MQSDAEKILELKAALGELALMQSDAEKIRELSAALGQLLDQVAQMRGLFPDDDTLDRAIDYAEKALELAR